jgi:phosphosulfolactate synthase (CoM biosynthesis protein A)
MWLGMAYAYLSTGSEKVMSEDREKMLRMALKAVLMAAVDQGLDLESLTEAAIESMLNDIAYMSEDVRDAALAIEVAADAISA